MDEHVNTDDNGSGHNTKRRRSQESPLKTLEEVEQRRILSSPCSSAQSTSSGDPPSSPDIIPDPKPPQPKVLPIKIPSPKVPSLKFLPPKELPPQVPSPEVPIPKVSSPKVPTPKVSPKVQSLKAIALKGQSPKVPVPKMFFVLKGVKAPTPPTVRRLPGSIISEVIREMKSQIIIAKELMKVANLENTQAAREELTICIRSIIDANDSLGPFKLREIEDMKVLLESQQGLQQQDDN